VPVCRVSFPCCTDSDRDSSQTNYYANLRKNVMIFYFLFLQTLHFSKLWRCASDRFKSQSEVISVHTA